MNTKQMNTEMNAGIKLNTIYMETYPSTSFWKVVKITPKTIVLRQMDHTRTNKFINRECGDKIERWWYWVYKCGDKFASEKTKIIKKTDYFGYEEGTDHTREYGLQGIYRPDELPDELPDKIPDVVSPEEDDEDVIIDTQNEVIKYYQDKILKYAKSINCPEVIYNLGCNYVFEEDDGIRDNMFKHNEKYDKLLKKNLKKNLKKK